MKVEVKGWDQGRLDSFARERTLLGRRKAAVFEKVTVDADVVQVKQLSYTHNQRRGERLGSQQELGWWGWHYGEGGSLLK